MNKTPIITTAASLADKAAARPYVSLYQFPKPEGGINEDLLLEEFRSAFPDRAVWSVDVTAKTVTFSLRDDPQPTDRSSCERVLEAHDPTGKTTEQRKEDAKKDRRTALAQFVKDFEAGVNTGAKENQAAVAALIVALGLDDD